ncbi:MAG: hypothetical protein WD076_05455 [Parvularculaceae bacterium]
MKGPDREERALAQLVKVARAKIDELSARLADLETAKASAESSLDWLDQAVRTEEAAARRTAAAPLDFMRYLAGADAKRKSLQSTRDTLAEEIGSIREALNEAFAEAKKLEHLFSINRKGLAAREQKTQAASADDLHAMRRGRR